MTKRVVSAFALMLSVVAAGCGGTPHDVRTPPGFVEVDEEEPLYDWRAIAPDGIAIAVRGIDVERGSDATFWERAFILRMREIEGYALIETKQVRSADGFEGRELLFGHDEEGKPFLYRVRLFVDGSRLVVAEAGGAKPEMERWSKSVSYALDSIRVD